MRFLEALIGIKFWTEFELMEIMILKFKAFQTEDEIFIRQQKERKQIMIPLQSLRRVYSTKDDVL